MPIEVVAALLLRGEKFLACQRRAHKARGLLWEFVGGKVEPGETKTQALVRECQEELGVTVSVGRPVLELTHAYPALTIHLTPVSYTHLHCASARCPRSCPGAAQR